MLITLLLTLALMLLLFAGMTVGLAMGRGPIKGSCGGIGAGGECPCGKKAGSCEASDQPPGTLGTSFPGIVRS